MSGPTTKSKSIPRARRRRPSPFVFFSLLGALATAALVFLLQQYTAIGLALSYFIAVNVVTFGLYLYDKTIAGWEVLRVPENALHLFELVGGTPFAFLAQRILHHKTQKTRYRIVFWSLAVLQLALIVWAALYWKR